MSSPDLPPRQVLLLFALLIWLGVLFAPLRISNPDTMRDFEVYWTAASRAAAAQPLYRIEDGHFQFKYLPAFAVVAAPASVMPLDIAKGKWLVISIALIISLVALSIVSLPERRRPSWMLATVIVIAMAKFYGHELVLGQVNLLFAVLTVCGMLALGSGAYTLAGLLVVAAIVVKPYAVLFLPWIALLGGWRAAISAAAGLVAVLVAPSLLYGVQGTIDLHRDWWKTVTVSTAPNLTNNDNVSLAAFAAKWLGVGSEASMLAAGLSVMLLAFAVLIVLRGRVIARREVLEGALLLTLVPLVSPQGWDYVFLVATPAIACLANYDDRLPPALRTITWTAIATIGLSLFDLLGRQRYATFMQWSIITICFLVVAAALGTLRFRRAA